MRQTNEQRKATAYLLAIAGGYRVELDAEGWPMVPGRLGRIEYHDDTDLAVFTHRRRLHVRILAIPVIKPIRRATKSFAPSSRLRPCPRSPRR